jgi:hypothetical protein
MVICLSWRDTISPDRSNIGPTWRRSARIAVIDTADIPPRDGATVERHRPLILIATAEPAADVPPPASLVGEVDTRPLAACQRQGSAIGRETTRRII